MDISEHHRQRLLELLTATGLNQATLAEKADLSPSYLSRLLYPPGKPGRKSLGVTTIHKIVDGLGLPRGWFELPLGAQLPAATQPPELSGYSVREPQAGAEASSGQEAAVAPITTWPFRAVGYRRFMALPREARAEIDIYLESMVMTWERKAALANAERKRR